MTGKTKTISEILKLARVNVKPGDTASGEFTQNDYPKAARRLITTLRIARVVCRIDAF